MRKSTQSEKKEENGWYGTTKNNEIFKDTKTKADSEGEQEALTRQRLASPLSDHLAALHKHTHIQAEPSCQQRNITILAFATVAQK